MVTQLTEQRVGRREDSPMVEAYSALASATIELGMTSYSLGVISPHSYDDMSETGYEGQETHIKGQEFVCEKCGECCYTISFPLLEPSTNQAEFWKKRNLRVEKRQTGWFLYLDVKCPHLTDDNLCAIYEQRPMMCRLHRCDKK